MNTDKHLELNEFRRVNIPKLDYKKAVTIKKLSPKLVTELKELWDSISENGIITPNNLRSYLREINDLCIEHEKKGTNLEFEKFLNHINEKMANPTTMEGTNKIFKQIKDSKIQEITPEGLFEEFEFLEEKISLEDLRYIMNIIAKPHNGINIDSEEFYTIMTKKPCVVDDILNITKLQK